MGPNTQLDSQWTGRRIKSHTGARAKGDEIEQQGKGTPGGWQGEMRWDRQVTVRERLSVHR